MSRQKGRPQPRAARRRKEFFLRAGVWIFIFIFAFSIVGALIAVGTIR
jgi:hypothetical protein